MSDHRTIKELIQAARLQTSKPDLQRSFSSFREFGESLLMDNSAMEATCDLLSPTEEDAIPQGSNVNRYRIVKKVGEGGMGEVYLAHHVRFTKRLFAIKFLKSGLVSAEMRDRFEAEISAMENLQHPNIVYAHDAGDFGGSTYLVMDFVEGLSFKAIVQDCLPIRTANIADLIRQAALGLQHAHEQGMVHRDIKPSNLMLSKEGVVKILDLGLAKIRDHDGKQLTMTQQILGTPDYMAPEQWQDTKTVDIRADIYSLGCTLYCLLAGRPPFDDEQHSSLATKLSGHLSEAPPEIDPAILENLPEEISQVLARMLEKKTEDRFQSPKEIVSILEPLTAQADLTELTSQINANEYHDEITRSIQNALEDTKPYCDQTVTQKIHNELVPSTQPGNTHLFYWIGVPLIFVLVLGFMFVMQGAKEKEGDSVAQLYPDAPKPNGDSKVNDLDISSSGESEADAVAPAFRNPITIKYFSREQRGLALNAEQQLISPLGEIGGDVASTRFGDGLKLDVVLDEPKFCYLFALNPTMDPEWKVQLCYPNEAEKMPERTSGFRYPPSENGYFPLTDGVGQVAFVLVQSEIPLPTFSNWKSQFIGDDFPWKVTQRAGVWEMKEEQLTRVFLKQKNFAARGGTVIVESKTLEKTLDRLRSDKHKLSVLAFSVEE